MLGPLLQGTCETIPQSRPETTTPVSNAESLLFVTNDVPGLASSPAYHSWASCCADAHGREATSSGHCDPLLKLYNKLVAISICA